MSAQPYLLRKTDPFGTIKEHPKGGAKTPSQRTSTKSFQTSNLEYTSEGIIGTNEQFDRWNNINGYRQVHSKVSTKQPQTLEHDLSKHHLQSSIFISESQQSADIISTAHSDFQSPSVQKIAHHSNRAHGPKQIQYHPYQPASKEHFGTFVAGNSKLNELKLQKSKTYKIFEREKNWK